MRAVSGASLQDLYDWKDPSMTEEAHLQSIKDRAEALKGSLKECV